MLIVKSPGGRKALRPQRQSGLDVEVEPVHLLANLVHAVPQVAGRGSESKRPFVIAVETTQDDRPRQAVIAASSLCREVVPPPNDTEC